MSDQIPWKDFRKAMNQQGNERRAKNRDNGVAILEQHGVEFESKNHGSHLIVRGAVDYWPGTGLWTDRASGKKGRGVFGLLKFLKIDRKVAE